MKQSWPILGQYPCLGLHNCGISPPPKKVIVRLQKELNPEPPNYESAMAAHVDPGPDMSYPFNRLS